MVIVFKYEARDDSFNLVLNAPSKKFIRFLSQTPKES